MVFGLWCCGTEAAAREEVEVLPKPRLGLPLKTPGNQKPVSVANTAAVQEEVTAIFDDKAMRDVLPSAVHDRFREALISGASTSEADMKVLTDCLFAWARENGATSCAHWFFPNRSGGAGAGGTIGSRKMDTLIDVDWSSSEATKPFKTGSSLQGCSDERDSSADHVRLGGGRRTTPTAAAFTTWDRSSPCFVLDRVLRIPCSFITSLGACIDDKSPLLRSNDALNREGLRLFKALNIATDARSLHSCMAWEQEFFVVQSRHYLARPDLVCCGRTLFGTLPVGYKPPTRRDSSSSAAPPLVQRLLLTVQATMRDLGVAMTVRNNGLAPGQYGLSSVQCHATFASDNNVLFMEVAAKEAEKLGLTVLFHEKPFAGINGSGKHSNWAVRTDTGIDLFNTNSDTDPELLVTSMACLAHGLKHHSELVRCGVATAGNDHRLGNQKAPPAIISMSPGPELEAHIRAIVEDGAPLSGYNPEESNASRGGRATPFLFCGPHVQFRSVGASQNCSFAVAMVNTVMAAGMASLSSLIEGGMGHRDAVAKLFRESQNVIFTGQCSAPEWPREALKRGLPNLHNAPLAIETFNSKRAKQVFQGMGVLTVEECDTRQQVMYENYNSVLNVEGTTMIQMLQDGIIPACAADIDVRRQTGSAQSDHEIVYAGIKRETAKLVDLFHGKPHEVAAEASYLCGVVKPQMALVRRLVDQAESLVEKSLYPYPTYADMIL